MCSRSLNKLAQPLPMAHCANSRLVCKISGDVMNENNPPMMLPNGYVYGYNVSGVGAGPGGQRCQERRSAQCGDLSRDPVCGVAESCLMSRLLVLTHSGLAFQSLLSIRQDDKVVCPRTKEVFHFSQAEKVYIM